MTVILAFLFGMIIGGGIGMLLVLWAFLRLDKWMAGEWWVGKELMEEDSGGK